MRAGVTSPANPRGLLVQVPPCHDPSAPCRVGYASGSAREQSVFPGEGAEFVRCSARKLLLTATRE